VNRLLKFPEVFTARELRGCVRTTVGKTIELSPGRGDPKIIFIIFIAPWRALGLHYFKQPPGVETAGYNQPSRFAGLE
jgi:hypothetical protein